MDTLKPLYMANVVLKNIKKVYPITEIKKQKKKAADAQTEPAANLQITDEGVVAVQEFNLDIADKEFIVLVGPSGCGKSTTLRMIAGLEEITEGEIWVDDTLVNIVEPKNRDIAMVFQNYALYPHMTVYDNMAFSLKMRREPKGDIEKTVREAAEILDITDYLYRKPGALSGGQRQRVAIGRAIVRKPKVFLMDEPLSNLDAKLRNQMRAELIKLRERIDTTFIYVTHDQIEAMTLGDRIVIMCDGYIKQIGTPQEVFHHPANLFSASFIGSPMMNFFKDARLILEDGVYYSEILSTRFRLPDNGQKILKDKNTVSKDITLGVRPANITIGGDGIDAEIDLHEMMGSELHLHLKSGGNKIVAVIPTDESGIAEITNHQKVKFNFRPELMHIFDNETEENLLNFAVS